MSLKIGMISLGCPKNQMDAELMLGRLREDGWDITPEVGDADIAIVNTCGFIEEAKQEAIDTILELIQLKKEKRIQKIVVTGCLAQRYREEIAKELPECDGVIGLGANHRISQVLKDVLAGETVLRFPPRSCWTMEGERLQTTPSFFAYLRIADGCDNRCAYCAIPLIRGGLRSRPQEAILQEARQLVQRGVKELILVAQDTTLYGLDRYGEPKLPELLEALCEIEGLSWIRLLYCYPEHITDRLLEVIASEEKIVKYIDLPLQHASGRVLKAMGRKGDRASLSALVDRIRRMVPGVVLRTTMLVGFPGETPEDFEELCAFIKDSRFERLGCFAFSPEEGTRAAEMPDPVPDREKNRRRDLVMELQTTLLQEYHQSLVGQTVAVLVESYDRYAECWFGRSSADAPDIDGKVFFTTTTPVAPGDMVFVKITQCLDFDVMGERI